MSSENRAKEEWKVGYADGSGPDMIVSGDKAVAVVRWGCDCCKDRSELTAAEIERAHLIAASPDLLMACRRAYAVLMDYPATTEYAREAMAAIEAAISKAEGKV